MRSLAAAIGVTHQTVSRWCDGVSVPRKPQVEKLTAVLGCSQASIGFDDFGNYIGCCNVGSADASTDSAEAHVGPDACAILQSQKDIVETEAIEKRIVTLPGNQISTPAQQIADDFAFSTGVILKSSEVAKSLDLVSANVVR